MAEILLGSVIDSCPDTGLYSDCSYLTAHNAFTIVKEGWTMHAQQYLNIEEQFDYGVRAFMIDIHSDKDKTLVLQHCSPGSGFCTTDGIGMSFYGRVTLASFLREINHILQKHPQDIITLILESYVTNSQILKEITLVVSATHLLSQNPNTATIQFMRKDNQRLVVLSDTHDLASGIWPPTHYKETTYSLNKDQRCVDRGENRAPLTNMSVALFVVNHFLERSCNYRPTSLNHTGLFSTTIIALNTCEAVNSYTEIAHRVELCKSKGLFGNFIAVDFVEQGLCGGARKVVLDLNMIGKSRFLSTTSEKNTPPFSTAIYDDRSIPESIMWSILEPMKYLYHYILAPLCVLAVGSVLTVRLYAASPRFRWYSKPVVHTYDLFIYPFIRYLYSAVRRRNR